MNDKVKNVMIILKMSNILHTMIETTTRIDIKQYEKYINKQVKTKVKLIKERRFKWSLMSSRKENYESNRVIFAKVKDILKEIILKKQLKLLKSK